ALIGSNEEEVAQRLGVSAEMVALIVANQLADSRAKQVDPARVVRSVGMDEISLKKRHQLYATILTDLSDPAHPEVMAGAPGGTGTRRSRASADFSQMGTPSGRG